MHVTLQGVQLAPGHVDSFATFIGTNDSAEMRGEVCALPGEVTAATEKLRAGGLQVTGIHNHFLGESPRLMFIHFVAHGQAPELARAFRAALATTTTPLGNVPPPRVSPAPDWAKTVQIALGHEGSCSADYGWLDVEFPRADFPAGPMDFWYTNGLFFQEAPGGKIATSGDLAVTAEELNRALSVLTERQFEILGVHNHMIDEQPRLFFLHFWKVGAPGELASGLKAALAVVHTRSFSSEPMDNVSTQPGATSMNSEESQLRDIENELTKALLQGDASTLDPHKQTLLAANSRGDNRLAFKAGEYYEGLLR